jgi:hypothetical protein
VVAHHHPEENRHPLQGRRATSGAVPTDAVVALEILSNKPLGIGVDYGWQPASRPMRVTEAEGLRLASLNAVPAVEVFEEHAETTGQPFDTGDPLPFFLHNVIMESGSAGDG